MQFPRVTLGRDRDGPAPFVAMQEGRSESVSVHPHASAAAGRSSARIADRTQETPGPVAPAEPDAPASPPSVSTSTATAQASSVDLVVDVVDVAAPPLPMAGQTTSTVAVAAQGPAPPAVLPATGLAGGTELMVASVVVGAGLAARALGRTPRPMRRRPAV